MGNWMLKMAGLLVSVYDKHLNPKRCFSEYYFSKKVVGMPYRGLGMQEGSSMFPHFKSKIKSRCLRGCHASKTNICVALGTKDWHFELWVMGPGCGHYTWNSLQESCGSQNFVKCVCQGCEADTNTSYTTYLDFVRVPPVLFKHTFDCHVAREDHHVVVTLSAAQLTLLTCVNAWAREGRGKNENNKSMHKPHLYQRHFKLHILNPFPLSLSNDHDIVWERQLT